MRPIIDCDKDEELFAYIENIIAGNKKVTHTPEGNIIFTGSNISVQ